MTDFTPALFDPIRDDVARLAALHRAAFAESWDTDAFARLLDDPGVFALVLREGFILMRVAGDEGEILTFAVAPGARRQGRGRALLRAGLVHAAGLGAKAAFLEVAAENPAALTLYAGLGFVAVGLRKAYYGGGGDAKVLKVQLPLPRGPEFA